MFINMESKPEITILNEKENPNLNKIKVDDKTALPSEKQQLMEEEEN